MAEAARRLGLTGGPNSARTLLKRNEVPLVEVHARTLLVEESDLEAFMEVRRGRGRPGKKEESKEAGTD